MDESYVRYDLPIWKIGDTAGLETGATMWKGRFARIWKRLASATCCGRGPVRGPGEAVIWETDGVGGRPTPDPSEEGNRSWRGAAIGGPSADGGRLRLDECRFGNRGYGRFGNRRYDVVRKGCANLLGVCFVGVLRTGTGPRSDAAWLGIWEMVRVAEEPTPDPSQEGNRGRRCSVHKFNMRGADN